MKKSFWVLGIIFSMVLLAPLGNLYAAESDVLVTAAEGWKKPPESYEGSVTQGRNFYYITAPPDCKIYVVYGVEILERTGEPPGSWADVKSSSRRNEVTDLSKAPSDIISQLLANANDRKKEEEDRWWSSSAILGCLGKKIAAIQEAENLQKKKQADAQKRTKTSLLKTNEMQSLASLGKNEFYVNSLVNAGGTFSLNGGPVVNARLAIRVLNNKAPVVFSVQEGEVLKTIGETENYTYTTTTNEKGVYTALLVFPETGTFNVQAQSGATVNTRPVTIVERPEEIVIMEEDIEVELTPIQEDVTTSGEEVFVTLESVEVRVDAKVVKDGFTLEDVNVALIEQSSGELVAQSYAPTDKAGIATVSLTQTQVQQVAEEGKDGTLAVVVTTV